MESMLGEILAYLSQGGQIMIPLILCSIFMWTLIIERLLFFSRLEKNDIKYHDMVSFLEQNTYPGGCEGVRSHLLVHLMSHRTRNHKLDQRIIDHCVLAMIPWLDRYLLVIAMLAAIAPLFGLLGTVTGMITTFDVITLFGTGNAKAMAGGISEALVTTQSGLLVSIPGLFMSALLYRKSQQAKTRMRETAMMLKRSLT